MTQNLSTMDLTRNFVTSTPSWSPLAYEDLQVLSPAEWKYMDRWSGALVFPKAIAVHEKFVKSRLGENAEHLSLEVRKLIREYILWCALQSAQSPEYIAYDKAMIEGSPVQVKPAALEIALETGAVTVPVSRVPIATKKGIRPGSDIIAASVACLMKSKEGKAYLSFNISDFMQLGFKHCNPSAIAYFTDKLLPYLKMSGGIKGRAWAYYLMNQFQQGKNHLYYELSDMWCRALFDLPTATGTVQLLSPLKENFVLVRYKDRNSNDAVAWTPQFSAPHLLRKISSPLSSTASYANVYSMYLKYSQLSQGDHSGVGMLSQCQGTWGLPSSSQVWVQTIVALALGSSSSRIVIDGDVTDVELSIIRASVLGSYKLCLDKKREKCEVWLLGTSSQVSAQRQVTDRILKEDFFIYAGNRRLVTQVEHTKKAKISVYSPSAIELANWQPVVEILDQYADHNVVYFGACFPPPNQHYQVYSPRKSADSQLVVSRFSVSIAAYGFNDSGVGVVRSSALQPFKADMTDYWGMLCTACNRVLTTWAVPMVSDKVDFIGLIHSPKIPKNVNVSTWLDEETGEYQVTYTETLDDDVVMISPPPSSPPVGGVSAIVPVPPLTTNVQMITAADDDDD